MKPILVDKELLPMELLELGPVLLIPKDGYIQVEKLPEPANE